MEKSSVFFQVRTDFLNIIQISSVLQSIGLTTGQKSVTECRDKKPKKKSNDTQKVTGWTDSNRPQQYQVLKHKSH
jgi:hypothetical protein